MFDDVCSTFFVGRMFWFRPNIFQQCYLCIQHCKKRSYNNVGTCSSNNVTTCSRGLRSCSSDLLVGASIPPYIVIIKGEQLVYIMLRTTISWWLTLPLGWSKTKNTLSRQIIGLICSRMLYHYIQRGNVLSFLSWRADFLVGKNRGFNLATGRKYTQANHASLWSLPELFYFHLIRVASEHNAGRPVSIYMDVWILPFPTPLDIYRIMLGYLHVSCLAYDEFTWNTIKWFVSCLAFICPVIEGPAENKYAECNWN